jgi:hypothetical protein
MTDQFEPQNQLEQLLCTAQQGDLAPTALMDTLIDAEIFMPIYEPPNQIGGLQTNERAQPLILTDDGQQYLILFTSPERAKHFVKDFPGYEGGLLVTVRWILERCGLGMTLALNPDQAVGLEIAAQDVLKLVDIDQETSFTITETHNVK